jgi:hypothetical protein
MPKVAAAFPLVSSIEKFVQVRTDRMTLSCRILHHYATFRDRDNVTVEDYRYYRVKIRQSVWLILQAIAIVTTKCQSGTSSEYIALKQFPNPLLRRIPWPLPKGLYIPAAIFTDILATIHTYSVLSDVWQ